MIYYKNVLNNHMKQWCIKGKCIKKEEKLDGGWSEWSTKTECSRSCGGGIVKQYRECTNPRFNINITYSPILLYIN